MFSKVLTTGLLIVVFYTMEVLSDLVVEAPSLYLPDKDRIINLNGTNFTKTIFQEERQVFWVVEFYKHWCGDCIRFVEVMKAAADGLEDWGDYVKIGAINCDSNPNIGVCRNLNITGVPTTRIFEPYSHKGALGVELKTDYDTVYRRQGDPGGFNTVDVAKAVQSYHNKLSNVSGIVNLKLLNDSDLLRLWNSYPEVVKYIVLVFEPKDSPVGSMLALDLSKTAEVRVRLVDPNNTKLYQLIGIKNGTYGFAFLEQRTWLFSTYTNIMFEILEDQAWRHQFNSAVRKQLLMRDVKVDKNEKGGITSWNIVQHRVKDYERDNAIKWENDVKKTLNITHLSIKVFSVDLQTTLYYVFTVEVAQKNTIAGETLKALKDFLTVIVKYFPATEPEKKFFNEFKSFLDGKESVTGININEIFVELERKYKPFAPKLNWLACRGTTPVFRGYPCGLWTLFHTLVASEELQKRNSSNKTPEALYAVGGYIKHFFTSVRGSENWELVAGSANTTEQALLWLWRAHNLRNGQFRASGSVDPYHGMKNFPTKEQCDSCYNGLKRSESKVFAFLSNMFTNITHIDQNVLQKLL